MDDYIRNLQVFMFFYFVAAAAEHTVTVQFCELCANVKFLYVACQWDCCWKMKVIQSFGVD